MSVHLSLMYFSAGLLSFHPANLVRKYSLKSWYMTMCVSLMSLMKCGFSLSFLSMVLAFQVVNGNSGCPGLSVLMYLKSIVVSSFSLSIGMGICFLLIFLFFLFCIEMSSILRLLWVMMLRLSLVIPG